jgi:hypothetical protein
MHKLEEIVQRLPDQLTQFGLRMPLRSVECPAPFVPVDVRETGMKGVLNGSCKEAYAGAGSEHSSAG